MLRRQFKHHMLRFDIDIVQVEDNLKDKKRVLQIAKAHKLDDKCYDELVQKLSSPTVCDGGYTYWNANVHGIFIVFFPISSFEEAVLIYDHEKRHTEDRMLEFCGIDDHETAAYLAGNLGVEFRRLQDDYIDSWTIE